MMEVATVSGVTDSFLSRAGAVPARSDADRWHQVALLGVAAATGADERARVGLAGALLALDLPIDAGAVLSGVTGDDPWARWWSVLAVGQAGDLAALDATLHAARAAVRPKGPDGRDVARMLADPSGELETLRGGDVDAARFCVLGHRARPERRALIGGRSSAAFVVDPSWEELRLVRLGPSDGPSGRNAAHLPFGEVLDLVRRGDAGPGRRVPDDVPGRLTPDPMLEALREDPAERDGRLLLLASEVRDERVRLAAERERLNAVEREIEAEREVLRRLRRQTSAARPKAAPSIKPPTTAAQAAALLGVDQDAPHQSVQRRWRTLMATCHPDRVEGLHPLLRERAKDLAVALNAARELLSKPTGR
jgi:hypothetical protein